MTLNCCSCFQHVEGRPAQIYGKYSIYDSYMRKSPLVSFEKPSIVQLRASLGKGIVANLPAAFKKKNEGRFVAVTFSGSIIAVCDTLEALNKEIVKKKLRENRENYYIERIGYPVVTQI